LFAPAGFTFAIWGVIYLLLAIFVFKACFYPKNQENTKYGVELNKICILFSGANVANTLWILSWHYLQIFMSLILMTVILVLLIMIALKIKHTNFHQRDKMWIKIPLSVYFGWITIATIANVTTYLVSIEWNGFGISEELWLIVMLMIGTLVVIATMFSISCAMYGMVGIWAYYGILSKHLSPSGFASAYPMAINVLYICIVLITVATLLTIKKTIRGLRV
jgi:hypothetical protein